MTDAHDDPQADCVRPPIGRRRWLRYSLRAIFALTVLASLPAFWVRTRLDDFAAEQQAIKQLRADGATIKTVAAEPAWLWKLFGKQTADKCQRAVEADLGLVRDATHEHMELVGRLRKLETLRVVSRVLTDEDLRPCRALTKLRVLGVGGEMLTDLAPEHFKKASKLESLGLVSPGIGDSGIAVIDGFPALRSLWIEKTSVGNIGMQHVAKARKLSVLSLPPTVTGEGLRHLGALDQLANLWIDIKDDDSNAALEMVHSLPALIQLVIRGGALSDEGLLHIAHAPRLTHLKVHDASRLTEQGIASLKSSGAIRHVVFENCAIDLRAVERLRKKLAPISISILSYSLIDNRRNSDLLRKRLRAPR